MTTTYDGKSGLTPTLPGSEPEGQTQSGALVTRRPTRAERRAANRAKRDAVTMAEQARMDAGLAGKSGGPQDGPGSAGPLTAKERREEQRQLIDQLRGQGILTRGRPVEYTKEEGDAICEWVGAGSSLKSYCRKTGRAMSTVYRWMREDAGFQTRYSRAHEDRADSLADEIVDIADAAAVEPTIEGVAAAKLQTEARKWIASKLKPSRWGERQTVQHTGGVSISIGIPAAPAVRPVDMGKADVIDG